MGLEQVLRPEQVLVAPMEQLMPLTAGLFPGAGADSASLRPHINPVHIGQLWGLPALAARIPSCLHWALAL